MIRRLITAIKIARYERGKRLCAEGKHDWKQYDEKRQEWPQYVGFDRCQRLGCGAKRAELRYEDDQQRGAW